jgi:hypothetical protein
MPRHLLEIPCKKVSRYVNVIPSPNLIFRMFIAVVCLEQNADSIADDSTIGQCELEGGPKKFAMCWKPARKCHEGWKCKYTFPGCLRN